MDFIAFLYYETQQKKLDGRCELAEGYSFFTRSFDWQQNNLESPKMRCTELYLYPKPEK